MSTSADNMSGYDDDEWTPQMELKAERARLALQVLALEQQLERALAVAAAERRRADRAEASRSHAWQLLAQWR